MLCQKTSAIVLAVHLIKLICLSCFNNSNKSSMLWYQWGKQNKRKYKITGIMISCRASMKVWSWHSRWLECYHWSMHFVTDKRAIFWESKTAVELFGSEHGNYVYEGSKKCWLLRGVQKEHTGFFKSEWTQCTCVVCMLSHWWSKNQWYELGTVAIKQL